MLFTYRSSIDCCLNISTVTSQRMTKEKQ